MKVKGMNYSLPIVTLLQDSGIGVSELAARTCYDSFDSSENHSVIDFNRLYSGEFDENTGLDIMKKNNIHDINDIEHSELLDTLAWTHFHHSILEHATVSYLIKGTSRAVLQEHARHRIQNISVRSTRYTMSGVINSFVSSLELEENQAKLFFNLKLEGLDMFVVTDKEYIKIETDSIWDKLKYQYNVLGKEEFLKLAVAKSSLEFVTSAQLPDDMFDNLQKGKNKRNVGDAFKHIVSDIWKVDMVVTFNIRSLKNYFELRDSGAAFFQIQWLAQAMKKVTPKKYLDLIIKEKR